MRLKLLPALFLLFLFGCTSVVEVPYKTKIRADEKTVYLSIDTELDIDLFSNFNKEGWTVIDSSDSVSKIEPKQLVHTQTRAAFKVTYSYFRNGFGAYTGTISLIDLRSGKVAASMSYNGASGSSIVSGFMKAINDNLIIE